jgi:hypothetical protein
MRTILAVLLFPLVACGGETDAPTGKASASAAPDPAAELGPYCEKVCKRSTSCGLEAAEKLVKGQPHEVAALDKLRKDAPKTEETCNTTCKASKVTAEESAMLARAKGCLEQTTCETFDRCLEDAGRTAGGT